MAELPLNLISFKGPFSKNDVYLWVSNIVPDFPKILDDEDAVIKKIKFQLLDYFKNELIIFRQNSCINQVSLAAFCMEKLVLMRRFLNRIQFQQLQLLKKLFLLKQVTEVLI